MVKQITLHNCKWTYHRHQCDFTEKILILYRNHVKDGENQSRSWSMIKIPMNMNRKQTAWQHRRQLKGNRWNVIYQTENSKTPQCQTEQTFGDWGLDKVYSAWLGFTAFVRVTSFLSVQYQSCDTPKACFLSSLLYLRGCTFNSKNGKRRTLTWLQP